MALSQRIKDNHLRNFLEDEYDVKILKKYGAYIVIKDGIAITLCYTVRSVREFLESKPNFSSLLVTNGLPEKIHKKWAKKQYKYAKEDDVIEGAEIEEEIEELSKEEETLARKEADEE